MCLIQQAMGGNRGGFKKQGNDQTPRVLIEKDPLPGPEDIQWSEGQVELETIIKIADYAQDPAIRLRRTIERSFTAGELRDRF